MNWLLLILSLYAAILHLYLTSFFLAILSLCLVTQSFFLMQCEVISKEQLNYSVLVNEASAEQQLKLLVIKRVRNPAHALQHASFTALC